MSASVRYQYARDVDGRCTVVGHVDPDQRGVYTCFGCNKPLVAHLGAKKAWHFQHKAAESACGRETYLHKLAKAAFLETYKGCLSSGRPFYLDNPVRGTCTHYQSTLDMTCDFTEWQRNDLTKFFDRIEVEQECNDFVADVLLSSTTTEQQLLIEFAVTHRCTPEKIESGLRIVEVNIEDELDIDLFRKGELRVSGKVCAYNLRPKPTTRPMCGGECNHKVLLFIVYESGKAWCKAMPPRDAVRFRRNSVAYKKVVPYVDDPCGVEIRQIAPYPDERQNFDPATLFQVESVAAFYDRIPIKTCYVCRYHGANGISAATFCKLHKKDAPANTAVDCTEYRPVGKRELKRIEAKNAEWMNNHGISFALSSILRTY